MANELFLLVEEAAIILRLSERTTYEYVRTKQVPAVRLGRWWRVPKNLAERLAEMEEEARAAEEGLKGLPTLLTPQEAAGVFRLPAFTVKKLLRAAEIPGKKIGAKRFISRNTIGAMMKLDEKEYGKTEEKVNGPLPFGPQKAGRTA